MLLFLPTVTRSVKLTYRRLLYALWVLALPACAFHSPPVISDINEDRIVVQLERNMLESEQSLAARRAALQEEARRGCAIYGRTTIINVSFRCVQQSESGSCETEEHLFACAP